jgi:cytochrome P450
MTSIEAVGSMIDLFSDATLDNPHPVYAELRELGPAVWMSAHELWAIPRYAAAREVLGDWRAFSSATGVGLNAQINTIAAGSVLISDPPLHDDLRRVLSSRLAPRSLKDLLTDMRQQADHLVRKVVSQGTFDAVADLAVAFPMSVVVDLIGFPEEASEHLMDWAEGVFNTFGPDNARMQEGFARTQEMYEYLAVSATRDRVKPGSFAATIYEAVDAGKIDAAGGLQLLAAYGSAGMDTTVNSISAAVALLAQHPDQWAALRADPALVNSAYEEVLRLESPVQGFGRSATRDYRFGDVTIPSGSQVFVLLGSANRDGAHYPDPDRFDIHRGALDHLAFGLGTHTCAGQGLARMEARCVLTALVNQVETLELSGTPTRRINNVVRGWQSVPVTVTTASAKGN